MVYTSKSNVIYFCIILLCGWMGLKKNTSFCNDDNTFIPMNMKNHKNKNI